MKIKLGFIIYFCLILSACSDVPLNQNATNFINDHQARQNTATPAQKDSYYYLLGIGANDDPLMAGKAYYDELQTALANNAKDELIGQINQKHPLHTLTINDTKTDDNTGLFCRFNANNSDTAHACFASLLNTQFDLTDYQSTLERYQQFLNNPPAIAQGKSHHLTYYPHYKTLTNGQRLYFIWLSKNHQPEQVMSALINELATLRANMAQANNLAEKMIYANLVANQIQTIVLYHSHNPTLKASILPLTQDELSFKTAFINEFMVEFETFNALKKEVKDLQNTLFYKHNKTLNDTADGYAKNIAISELSAPEFATYYANYQPEKPKHDFTNFIGKTLSNIGPDDYRFYISKLKSIDNLISIANHRMNGTPLANVFAPTLNGIIPEKDHICIQNPISHDEKATELKKRDEKFECLVFHAS